MPQLLPAARHVAALALGLLAACAHAAYPDRPITLIVPQPPGGAADAVARPFAAALQQKLGQPVVVENKPGANGNIAASYVARQTQSDGYTIFFGSISTFCVNPQLYKSPGFDPFKDFQPITLTNSTPNVLVVGAQTNYKSLGDVVADAKKQPGALSFGSAGNGNTMHLTGLMFEAATGTKLVHVPYKGGPAALNDVLAGQIPMMFHNLNAVTAFEKAGKVRILAVADGKRSPFAPDVPTMTEAGAPNVLMTAWSGMVVRAGTPDDIVQKLHAAMIEILKSPEFRKPQEAAGTEVLSSTPAEFSKLMRDTYERMTKVIQDNQVSID